MAEKPLLPREDAVVYAASKRKSDAPLTATTTITPSSSSGDAKAGGYKQLLEEGEEPPAAARGGVWGAFDAVRTYDGIGWGGQPAFYPRVLGNPDLGPERINSATATKKYRKNKNKKTKN